MYELRDSECGVKLAVDDGTAIAPESTERRVMTTELLEIEPPELKFVFELKKQTSCLVQLGNKSDQYVAFKVKTTSPKKYCVRPNIGIIKPKENCDFTVTMQAQKIAPPHMQCKDKFLIQSTIVPFGTTQNDIKSDMFARDSGKHIEEKKLRVVLISPPSSPVLLPVNGHMKQDNEIYMRNDRVPSGVENYQPPLRISVDVKGLETAQNIKEDRSRTAEDIVSTQAGNMDDVNPAKYTAQLNLAEDSEELKSRVSIMESKIREAKLTIMKLTEERSRNTREKNKLKQELEILKRKVIVTRVQVGFPLMYVCMVALISVAVGYYIHP